MDKAKVEGHNGLEKDLVTKAIINSDKDAFKQALEAKEKRLAELRRVDELESKLESLTFLVEKLLEGKNK